MEDAATPIIVQDLLPIQVYLTDWYVRVTWIAFMTLWVFWGLTWFIRNAFGGDSSTHGHLVQHNTQIAHDPHLVNNNNYATNGVNNGINNNGINNNGINNNGVVNDPETGLGTNSATTATPAGTTTKTHSKFAAPAWTVNVFHRLNRAHDMLRDLVLMLLSVLTLNTFARASTRGVMIIAWLFVALAFVSFVVEASYEHRYLRLLYSLAFYTLGLAVVGLAYADGFYA